MLATLLDDWDEMTSEERRHLIGTVFAEVYADADAVSRILPREDWKPYMAAVLRTPACWTGGLRSGRRGSTRDPTLPPRAKRRLPPIAQAIPQGPQPLFRRQTLAGSNPVGTAFSNVRPLPILHVLVYERLAATTMVRSRAVPHSNGVRARS
jgi:hypothetical protein